MAFNRLIELRHRTIKRDKFGSEVEAWDTLAIVWAEKLWVKPAERFVKTSAKILNQSTALFKILARADVNELMRVKDDNDELWDIRGIFSNDWKFLTLQVGHLP